MYTSNFQPIPIHVIIGKRHKLALRPFGSRNKFGTGGVGYRDVHRELPAPPTLGLRRSLAVCSALVACSAVGAWGAQPTPPSPPL